MNDFGYPLINTDKYITDVQGTLEINFGSKITITREIAEEVAKIIVTEELL